MARWRENDIPNLHGRSAVVTGTGGLGYATALALARAGCDVTIAGRNPQKGTDAVARIKRDVVDASACFRQLDLTNGGSFDNAALALRDEDWARNAGERND